MLQVKEKFFDRFDQSFKLFKSNFIVLFLPLFIYNLVYIIIWIFLKYYLLWKIIWFSDLSLSWLDFFTFLNNSQVVFSIVIWMIFFILYLFLYIAIFLWILKTIRKILNSEEVNMLDNVKYGFSRFLLSMKTYWYIFAYVALIPALIFIVWWLLFSIWYNNNELSKIFWIILLLISFVLFAFFAIYRWNKARFALYSAIDKDEFNKENFNISLKNVDNNWYRVFWNIFLLWIILSFASSLIWWILNLFLSIILWWTWISDSVMNNINNPSYNSTDSFSILFNFLEKYFENFSFFNEILTSTLHSIINISFNVFSFVFIYILFKRLGLEKLWKIGNDEKIKVEKIEL